MDVLRTWQNGGVRLETWDTGRTDSLGKTLLRYELREFKPQQQYYGLAGELIFAGEDFACSPLHAIDSDAALGGLLGFLSLRPGDTDDEYFENYTERQLRFADEHGELLSMFAMELEDNPVTAVSEETNRNA